MIHRDAGSKTRFSHDALRPAYFEQVFDLLDAINSADDFLGHLFLEEGIDVSAKADGAFLGFDEDSLAGDVGAGLEGDGDLFE